MRCVMTPAQCRAARALLKWTQEHLADAAQVSALTIRNFENERTAPLRSSLAALTRAIEAGGVELIGERGVQFRD